MLTVLENSRTGVEDLARVECDSARRRAKHRYNALDIMVNLHPNMLRTAQYRIASLGLIASVVLLELHHD